MITATSPSKILSVMPLIMPPPPLSAPHPERFIPIGRIVLVRSLPPYVPDRIQPRTCRPLGETDFPTAKCLRLFPTRLKADRAVLAASLGHNRVPTCVHSSRLRRRF